LTIGVLAAVAQHEREAISARTKAALAAAKSRGVRLGNPRLAPGTATTAAVARRELSAQADKFSNELRDVIEAAQADGLRSDWTPTDSKLRSALRLYGTLERRRDYLGNRARNSVGVE
jgi:hypothetical protein